MSKPLPMDRIAFVHKLLAKQVSHREIQLRIQEKFGCSGRQGYNYIKHSYARMASEDKLAKPMRKLSMRVALQHFYQKALSDKAYAPALAALDRLCKLDGLYVPEEVSISHSVQARVEQMTSDDQRRQLEKLFAQYDVEAGAARGGDGEEQPTTVN